MFEACTIGGVSFQPALFCAPLAGYTHSAFRRLVAELGGCGALWTEMLAARQILSDDFARSPWVRSRTDKPPLFFQLMVRDGDPLEPILGRLAEQGAQALDLNLACHAMSIRACEAGSALFEDLDSLRRVVDKARCHWRGLLTVKIRLGRQRADWQLRFAERIRALEECGVDAIILHPRFFEDKFKRRARLELIPWAATLTSLPLIANGDLVDAAQVQARAECLQPACALMIGRMAIVRPWIFATWDRSDDIDPAVFWRKMYRYILEDFAPPTAIRRIKMFTKYFAANYVFGHRFHVEVSNARTLADLERRAEEFFARSPARVKQPSAP
jgi:tRNA-dihydrouridine synthase